MKIKVGLIDYGMGNLHSVAKAFSSQGAAVRISEQTARLKESDLIVLPGVGSFGAAAQVLRKMKLDEFVQRWVLDEKPYFGICLGYQLLFEQSDESPGITGLGLMKGSVVRFARHLTVPHMGWNQVKPKRRDPLFKGIKPTERFYFVHSYYPKPRDKNVVGSTTTYGSAFCSSVKKRNLFACQFHPEKSGTTGLKLIANALRLVKEQRP